MKTKGLSKEELYKFFCEHITYEIQMLLNATYVILNQISIPNSLQNMPLESYAIHLRNLITFFYPSNVRDTDVSAKDFYSNEDIWEKVRPPLSGLLEHAKSRADKEVGHLTIFRQYGTPETKIWDVKKLTNEIMPLVELICETSDKFDQKLRIDDITKYYSQGLVK